MSFNLIEEVKEVFAGDMTNKLAGLLGESQVNVQKALQGVIPSVLSGIILKSETTDVHDFYRVVSEAAKIEIPFNQNSLAWWWDKKSVGTDYKKLVFDERSEGLTDAIANYAGVSRHSAFSLLSIAAPGALGVLGKHVTVNKINAAGLRNYLTGESRQVLNEMPTGLFLEGLLGYEKLTPISEKLLGYASSGSNSGAPLKWLVPVLALLLGIFGTWFFLKRPSPPELPSQSLNPPPANIKEDTPVKAIAVVSNSQYSFRLPDGKIVSTSKGSLEDQLFRYFSDNESKPSRKYQFNFDQIDFNKGSATISGEGMGQVQNVASVLRAYPKARIVIGGFNSRGGDSIRNKILCENRAFAVAAALKSTGANANQITGVVSFGSDFARYPSYAADSLRARDDRIAISVRAK